MVTFSKSRHFPFSDKRPFLRLNIPNLVNVIFALVVAPVEFVVDDDDDEDDDDAVAVFFPELLIFTVKTIIKVIRIKKINKIDHLFLF